MTYVDRCKVMANRARAAGLHVEGALAQSASHKDRAGIIVRKAFTSPEIESFMHEHGYTACPNGRTHTIIEEAS